MKHLLLFSIALFFLQSCKKDVENLPEERPFERKFYVQGDWRDTVRGAYSFFDYTIGREVASPLSNIFSCKSEQKFANGVKTIQASVYGFAANNPTFLVRFSAPGTSADWSPAELQDLFAPGRIFPITGAPGEVELGFEIPFTFNTNWISYASTAPQPSGEVKILSSETYEWQTFQDLNNPVTRKGLRVKLQFQALLGRVLVILGEEKVVGEAEVKNGDAVLIFEY